MQVFRGKDHFHLLEWMETCYKNLLALLSHWCVLPSNHFAGACFHWTCECVCISRILLFHPCGFNTRCESHSLFIIMTSCSSASTNIYIVQCCPSSVSYGCSSDLTINNINIINMPTKSNIELFRIYMRKLVYSLQLWISSLV